MTNNYSFDVSDEMAKEIDEWIEEKQGPPRGTIGGQFTYSFTPTSLGVVVKVTDSHSSETKDFTDYLSW